MTVEEAVEKLIGAGLPTKFIGTPYCLFIGGTRVADLWSVPIHVDAFKVFEEDELYVLFAPDGTGHGTHTEHFLALEDAVDRIFMIYGLGKV